jgi:hypothetical protein
MLTHIQKAKIWQSFLCVMCVNKIYGGGKCCTKENKEAEAFEAYQKEIQLFVNKVGFWEDATEFQKVSSLICQLIVWPIDTHKSENKIRASSVLQN